MKAFKVYRKYFSNAGVSLDPEDKYRTLRRAAGVTIFLIVFIGNISNIMFVILNVSTDLESSLYSVFSSTALTTCLFQMMVGFRYPQKLSAIFAKFQQFYDESNSIFFTKIY